LKSIESWIFIMTSSSSLLRLQGMKPFESLLLALISLQPLVSLKPLRIWAAGIGNCLLTLRSVLEVNSRFSSERYQRLLEYASLPNQRKCSSNFLGKKLAVLEGCFMREF